MLFNSPVFIFYFLPTVLVVSALLRSLAKSDTPYLGSLLVASLAFYGYTQPTWVLIFAGSIAFNYLVGQGLARAHRHRRFIVTCGVVFNLGLLGYFKYTNFFVTNITAALNLHPTLFTIVLPIGISFYTFQQIAYLVDVYREPNQRHSFLDYALFVTFFPQLIAGPIVHHNEFISQLHTPKRTSFVDDLSEGSVLFLMGLAKKVLLADTFGVIADATFSDPTEVSSVGAWIGVTAYTLQIYFDFSGYSDMAIGLGRLFGFDLPINFDAPYKSRSFIEFWRRWHITLSRFLRDYLYISIGGNRRGKLRRYGNLLATMVLGGLWHGAGWGFIVWGALHGIFLALNHSFRTFDATWQNRLKLLGRPITLLGVIFAWVPFRANSLHDTLEIWHAMVIPRGGTELVDPWISVIRLLAGWGVALFAPTSRDILESLFRDPALVARTRNLFAAVIGVAAACGIATNNRIAAFLYFQF